MASTSHFMCFWREKCSISTWDGFILFSKCRAPSYNNDTFHNSGRMFSSQETTLVICGTKRGPVGTSQAFPEASLLSFKMNVKGRKDISLLWQFKSNFTSRKVSTNQVRKHLHLCVWGWWECLSKISLKIPECPLKRSPPFMMVNWRVLTYFRG